MKANKHMGRPRIVIASVLKPLDDTRMFGKMAASLTGNGTADVYIIGQAVKGITANPGIHFIGLKPVERLGLGRLLLPLKILIKTLKVKPSLLIVNTHELLIVSIVNRILFGCKIAYDIRENYYRNILYSEAFRGPIKWPVALWVRLKEKVASPLFHHFILAEKAYENELGFVGERYTILENKALPQHGFARAPADAPTNLLFSGTIAASTGIFQAIELAQQLHQADARVRLSIVGYCALPHVREKVAEAVAGKPWISLKGFNHLVPHREIMEEIRHADFGIVYYPPSPHTSGAVPTKLYEYMACQLPVLTWKNQSFAHWVTQNQAGLIVEGPVGFIWVGMMYKKFHPRPIDGLVWEGEKFRKLAARLLGLPPVG